MHYKTKENLIRKIGVLGLSDLRRLAPIGDIGYMNGWYHPFFNKDWASTEMPKLIYQAAKEQGFEFTHTDRGYGRGTNHEYYCEELGLMYHVDSSG